MMEQNRQTPSSSAPGPGGTGGAGWGAKDSVIVVALDGSVESKAALNAARLLSRVVGAALHVVHAVERPFERKELLRSLKLSRREETIGLIIDQVVGAPAETILQTAAQKGALLIALSTRSATPTRPGQPLRPVAERVLLEANRPVLLVRPEVGPRVAANKALRRILLPLDGEPSSMAALRPALDIADKAGALLYVLYVAQFHARAAHEPGTLTTPRYVDQPQYEWPAWTKEYVERFCAIAQECQPSLETRIFVRRGEPADEITHFAAERDTDLIVLEWRGHLDASHASIVCGVLEKAPCPVLLLRKQNGD